MTFPTAEATRPLSPGMPHARPLPWQVSLRAVAALLVGGVLLWAAALKVVDYRAVTDLGLVSVLPVWAYLAFVPIVAAMAWILHRPSVPLLPAIVVSLVLIAVLYGSSPLLAGEPRIAAAWRHLGVIDYILRNGRVDPTVDVYHNWPGYFALVATLAQVAGVGDLRDVALWAPVWQNVVYLPALYLLLTSFTTDRRVVWLAIWVFYATNWIGQDYLSPQALGFLVYLVLAALFVRWLAFRDARTERESAAVALEPRGPADAGAPPVAPATGRFRRGAAAIGRVRASRIGTVAERGVRALVDRLYAVQPPAAADLGPWSRVGLAGAVVALFGFVVTAHQLTPFFVVAMIVALAVLFRMRWLVLPILMLVMIAGWALLAAVPYLTGHLDQITATSGGLGGVDTNVAERLSGSAEHGQVIVVRLAMTALVWAIAGLGVLRRLRTGHWDVTLVALAAAPFPLFVLQSYGGEMLLRITLFSLPPIAALVALAVLPKPDVTSVLRTIAVGVLLLVLLPAFMLTRYGNERLETFTAQEVAVVDALYTDAPPGSLLVAISGNLPWKASRYELYRYRPSGDDTYFDRLETLLATAHGSSTPVYLVVTRAQRVAAEMLGGARPGEFDAFIAEVLATGQFQVVYRNEDGLVAHYIGESTAP